MTPVTHERALKMTDSCRTCPVCDRPPKPDDRIAKLTVNHHHRQNLERQSYDLTYCSCGELVYISPLPSDADIRAMYAEAGQFGAHEGQTCAYRGERGTAVLEYTTACLVSILRFIGADLVTRFRVLEVGAGLSWMCRAAKILDWGNVTVAQDLSAEAVDECRWVDHYIVEDILTSHAVDPHGPYDVMSMTHVFEHLADPVGMLRRLAELLAPQGVLLITAPYRPVGWRRGADISLWEGWSYNHVPAHIQYFSAGSFEKAANAAGLEVVLWNDNHDGGQAFEGWLRHKSSTRASM